MASQSKPQDIEIIYLGLTKCPKRGMEIKSVEVLLPPNTLQVQSTALSPYNTGNLWSLQSPSCTEKQTPSWVSVSSDDWHSMKPLAHTWDTRRWFSLSQVSLIAALRSNLRASCSSFSCRISSFRSASSLSCSAFSSRSQAWTQEEKIIFSVED